MIVLTFALLLFLNIKSFADCPVDAYSDESPFMGVYERVIQYKDNPNCLIQYKYCVRMKFYDDPEIAIDKIRFIGDCDEARNAYLANAGTFIDEIGMKTWEYIISPEGRVEHPEFDKIHNENFEIPLCPFQHIEGAWVILISKAPCYSEILPYSPELDDPGAPFTPIENMNPTFMKSNYNEKQNSNTTLNTTWPFMIIPCTKTSRCWTSYWLCYELNENGEKIIRYDKSIQLSSHECHIDNDRLPMGVHCIPTCND